MDIKQKALDLRIATEFGDACANFNHYVSDDILEFFCKKISDEKSLRWQSALDAIYVVNEHELLIDVVSKTDNIKVIDCKSEVLGIIDTNKDYNKYQIKVLDKFEIGYHDIKVDVEGKIYNTTLAVAPLRCYEAEDKKLWGMAVQLYSLRSSRNWGVGDFTDLKELVKILAQNGADLIGLNPVNVLNHSFPEDASPYCASSRLFINPIYIDVENVSGFKAEYLNDVDLDSLRKIEIIDYTNVYKTKIYVLEKVFAEFIKKPNKEFATFCKDKGEELDNLATFQAISEFDGCNWRKWNKCMQTPNSKDVINFKKINEYRINFFKFLQFEADNQFASVAKAVSESKMSVGIYRDLPVGVGQNSAEYWSNQEAFISEAGAGAPPDMFNPKGQNWSLGAFNPYTLKQQKYMPMIRVLRANMAHAGALRLDHVMWLMRLFVIPNNKDEGTYIYYNFEDMLNILAIESHLNKCFIVGESIGNVPDGFLDKLKERNISPISVLWAEKYDCGWGEFKNPQDYSQGAFVSTSTHDMPPLRMWWFGLEIALQRKLGLIDSDEAMGGAYNKREEDRRKLLRVLDNNNLWPQDNLRFADYIYGEDYPEGIVEATNNMLVKSASKCFLMGLEDIFEVEKLQNLPGTDRDKHPNWRRKLPTNIEDFLSDDRFVRNMNLVKQGR
ncbi:MAG: 4-alpha-glucanotransferase [Alphaproteobacteria bacterium]